MDQKYPKSFFSEKPPEVEKQTCFVIMPFDKEFRPVYDSIIAAVTGPELNFSSCRRADELSGGGHVMADVLAAIARGEVIVADVTKPNPNVFYELGIAHTVKPIQTVIIITQSVEGLPFDINNLRCIVYEPTTLGLEILKGQLCDSIRRVTPAGLRFVVADQDTFTFHTRLPGPDRYLYDFDVGPVVTGMNFAKFRMVLRRYAIGRPVEIVSTNDYGINEGESVDIPFLRWKLNLDVVGDGRAHFCLCDPASDAARSDAASS